MPDINPYIQYMYSYPHKTAYRAMAPVPLEEYLPYLSGFAGSLYLHIPFCQSRCGYCNLFSVTGQSVQMMDRYLSAVKRQLVQLEPLLISHGCHFSDLTIGGGTPLLLTEHQLDDLFTVLHHSPPSSALREIVIETAPNQTTREKLRLLKQAGVTRVSMGIQSFSDAELHTLVRQHSAQKAREALDMLMSENFSCVNIDFIYGIPGQTEASLLKSLEEALTYAPDEIFLYPLYIKHGAGLEKQLGRGFVLNPQKAYAQYREAARYLSASGFRQDSMRRFVKKTDGAARQFSDCGFGSSLALGCGGRSYLGNLHFCTPYAVSQKDSLARLEEFIRTSDFTAITHGMLLSKDEQKRRFLIRHLLIYPGLDEAEYEKQFQCRAAKDFPILEEWMKKGYLVRGEYLALTQDGLALSDYLGPQLISPEVRLKMNEWEDAHSRIRKYDNESSFINKH